MMVLFLPRSAAPQTRSSLSIGLQVAQSLDHPELTAIGTHALIALPATFAIYPAVLAYSLSSGTAWRLSTTLRWAPGSSLRVGALYIGAGPFLAKHSLGGMGVKHVGALAQMGAEPRLGAVRLFLEIQVLSGGPVSAEGVAGLRIAINSHS